MSTDDNVSMDKVNDHLEWDYAPPPTPYDLIRDNIMTRLFRLILHCAAHSIVYSYNKLTVINRRSVINNWPCIITPNHSSHMDTMAIFSSLPLKFVNRLFALAAKDYFFRNGTITFGARLIANTIPIDRTGTETEGLQLCHTKLKEGNGALIFPEGTRSTTGEIGQFKKGAILLSKTIKVPIVPAYINGTLQSMPKSASFPRPAKITVMYGEPLCYWESPLNSLGNQRAAQHLKNRIKEMETNCKENQVK